MKTRLLWFVSLCFAVSVAVFATTAPINRALSEKAPKPTNPAIVEPNSPAVHSPADKTGSESTAVDQAALARRMEERNERASVIAQIRAAKNSGETPNPELYRRLKELTPPGRTRDSGHLDQGGETCANATEIPSVPYSDFGTTTGYTDNYNTDCGGSGGNSPDVVYSFAPTVNGSYHVSLCGSNYDTRLFVYAGTCSGEPIACNDDGPNCWPSSDIASVELTAGTTYFIIVDGYGDGSFGDYTLLLEEVAPPPPGDVCAAPFVAALPYSETNASTCGYAHNYDGTCVSFAEGPDVVYQFTLTAPTSVEVVLNAHPAEGTMPEYVWPTVLLSSHCPPDWDCIASAWTITADVLYLPCQSLPAGTYYVVISSETWYHPCFSYDLIIRACASCQITSQPGDVAEVAEPWPVPGTYSINDPDGGCNNAAPYAPQYQNITTSQTIFGRTFAYTDSISNSIKADADWYRIVAATPTNLTCTYGGESMLRVRLQSPPCPGVIELTGTPATPCYTGTFTQCLEPGEYFVRIERSGPMSTPDAQPLEYRATFTLAPCQLPLGRCCYAGTCANNTHPECEALAGNWDGSVTCDEPCPFIPPNDNCQNAGTPAPLPAIFTGTNINATNDCPLYEGDPQVWHAFVTTEVQDIQVDYCGTVGFSSFNPWLYNGCPCAQRTMLDVVDWGYCDTTAMTGIWRNLPAGTWYISVTMYNPNSIGAYTLHVNAVSSAPPANDECSTATPVTLVPNGSVTVTGTTLNGNPSCSNICNEGGFDYSSTGNDVFYSLTLSECRRVAMALGNGDMHISVYDGQGNCCTGPAVLCNDDDVNFLPLPVWDVATQHPGGSRSYVAAALEPGVYLIRVAKYASQSGAYTLTLYDNGSCNCVPPAVNDVTVLGVGSNVEIRWSTAAEDVTRGTYRIYANSSDMPVGDPSWSVIGDAIVPVAGQHHLYYTAPFAANERHFYYVTGVCLNGSPQSSAGSKP